MNPVLYSTILRHLCFRRPFFTFDQMLRLAVLAGLEPLDKRKMQQGVVDGVIVQDRVFLIQPDPLPTAPTHCWNLGDPEPDFSALEYALAKRWNVEPRIQSIYRAGRVLWRVYGNAMCRGLNPAALSHDAFLGDVFLHLLETAPQQIEDWRTDAILRSAARRREKLPDVILHDQDDRPYLVIEAGGRYSAARLLAFHRHCAAIRHGDGDAIGLPYQLW